MNDVVERVARAICAEEQGGPLGYFPDGSPMRPGGVWHEYSEKQHNEWRAVARAAIEAMREPTEAMIDAHDRCHAEAEFFFADPADVWSAMLSAALADALEVRARLLSSSGEG